MKLPVENYLDHVTMTLCYVCYEMEDSLRHIQKIYKYYHLYYSVLVNYWMQFFKSASVYVLLRVCIGAYATFSVISRSTVVLHSG